MIDSFYLALRCIESCLILLLLKLRFGTHYYFVVLRSYFVQRILIAVILQGTFCNFTDLESTLALNLSNDTFQRACITL